MEDYLNLETQGYVNTDNNLLTELSGDIQIQASHFKKKGSTKSQYRNPRKESQEEYSYRSDMLSNATFQNSTKKISLHNPKQEKYIEKLKLKALRNAEQLSHRKSSVDDIQDKDLLRMLKDRQQV